MPARLVARASSSRASSAAPSDVGAGTTPRRSSRRNVGSSQLPPVTTRESTSYGSSIAVVPTEIRRRGHERDLTETLAGILGTAQENHQTHLDESNQSIREGSIDSNVTQTTNRGGRSQRGGTTTPHPRRSGRGSTSVISTPGNDASQSFQIESGIFGEATFGEDPTILQPDSDRSQRGGRPKNNNNNGDITTIQEEPETPETMERIPAIPQPMQLETGPLWTTVLVQCQNVYNYVTTSLMRIFMNVFAFLNRTIRWLAPRSGLIIAYLLIAAIAGSLWLTPLMESPTDGYLRSNSLNILRNIGQYIPHSIAHPLNDFDMRDVYGLQKRLGNVEYEVVRLKKRLVLDEESLLRLEHLLPDFLLFKKNEMGEKHIPAEFWRALKQKIQADLSLLQGMQPTVSESPANGAAQESTSDSWTDFLHQNEVKIRAWQRDGFDSLWARNLDGAFKDNILISKAEFLEMFRQNWDESQKMVKAEIQRVIENLGTLEQRHRQGVSERQVKDISQATLKEMLSGAQLEALAQIKVQQNIIKSLQRVNHFSLGIGAVISPPLTSPTYAFSVERAGIFKRILLNVVGYPLPSPHSPAKALTKWDEAGDCWCSPSNGTGSGVQLGVLMANDVYPDEVVVEHIPMSATLDFGSAPKDMELLAKIEGANSQNVVGDMSERLFPNDESDPEMDERWFKIGGWTYDAPTDNNPVQAFHIQVDLKQLGISTRQLVVRAKNNWGGLDHTCLYRVRVHGDIA